MKLIDNNKTASNTFETLFSSKYKTFIAPTPMHHVDNIILLAHSNSYSIFQNKNNIEFMEENKLKHQLQDLVYLWDVHNYKISLEKYDQSEPGGIGNFGRNIYFSQKNRNKNYTINYYNYCSV